MIIKAYTGCGKKTKQINVKENKMKNIAMKKEKKAAAKRNIVKGMNHRLSWLLMNPTLR